MDNPEVSVIISVYNDENYLESALKSLLDQTFDNIEIIFIDDGSTDNSLKIAQKFSKKDKRIKVFTTGENIGKTKAINKFLCKINGKYVTFLDGDDILDRRRIKEQLEFMKKQKLDFSYCDVIFFNVEGKDKIAEAIDYKDDFRDILIEKSKEDFDIDVAPGHHLGYEKHQKTIFGGEFMLKTEVFDKCKFDGNLKNLSDHDFWFQVIGKGFKIGRFPKAYYIYRRYPSQKSKNKKMMLKANRYINKKLKAGAYFN